MSKSIYEMLKDCTPMQHMDNNRLDSVFIQTMMSGTDDTTARKHVAGSTYDRCAVSNNPDLLTRRMNQLSVMSERNDFKGDTHRISTARDFSELHMLLMESKAVTDCNLKHEILVNESYKIIFINSISESDRNYADELDDNGNSFLVAEFGEAVGRLFVTITKELFGDETLSGYDDENMVILYSNYHEQTVIFAKQ